MKKNLIISGLIAILVAVSLFCGYKWGLKNAEPEVITETKFRTIHIKDPAPSFSFNTGKLIFVPVEAFKDEGGSVTHLVPLNAPAASPDSIESKIVVELPEEVREYTDSTEVNDTQLYYRIGVRGYNPSLAYADFSIPYTQTTCVENRKEPLVEVAVGPVGGFGYGFINCKPDFFVGVGVALKFNLNRKSR